MDETNLIDIIMYTIIGIAINIMNIHYFKKIFNRAPEPYWCFFISSSQTHQLVCFFLWLGIRFTRIAEIVLARWVIKAQNHKTNKATTTQAVYVEDTLLRNLT